MSLSLMVMLQILVFLLDVRVSVTDVIASACSYHVSALYVADLVNHSTHGWGLGLEGHKPNEFRVICMLFCSSAIPRQPLRFVMPYSECGIFRILGFEWQGKRVRLAGRASLSGSHDPW